MIMPASAHLPFLLLSLFFLAFGSGLNNPTTLSLISQNTPNNEQGAVLGVNQSLSALARFIGPVWGGFVYEKLGYQYPFFTGGIFMLFLTIFSIKILKRK
jgi:MFS family permease